MSTFLCKKGEIVYGSKITFTITVTLSNGVKVSLRATDVGKLLTRRTVPTVKGRRGRPSPRWVRTKVDGRFGLDLDGIDNRVRIKINVLR